MQNRIANQFQCQNIERRYPPDKNLIDEFLMQDLTPISHFLVFSLGVRGLPASVVVISVVNSSNESYAPNS